ncbi:MAG TPA: hypothetical protein VGG38_17680, partial [Acidimicrobiales bacterium]
YTQLTGRAGRRGIDDAGYAVVLCSPFVPFDQVATLAGARSYALSSSFRPTYNMAVNLVRRYPPERAHHLLNLSFAQYQADGDVVRLEARLERTTAMLAEARGAATCERGDVGEYRHALQASEEAELRPSRSGWVPAGKGAAGRVAAGRVAAGRGAAGKVAAGKVAAGLARIRPGDVLVTGAGRVAVLTTSRRRGGDVRLRVVTPERRVIQLGVWDFSATPRSVGRVELPTPFAPNNARYRRQVASALMSTRFDADVEEAPIRVGPGELSETLAAAAAHHPVASCPSVRSHLRAYDRVERLQREVGRIEGAIKGRTESLARQFDRVLRVLEEWGYVQGWALTDRGERLARIYHEADLLVTQCLTDGLLDGLGPAELAGLVSVFTFESRGPTDGVVVGPGGGLRERWKAIVAVATELNRAEDAGGLPLTRRPDPGFVSLARRWVGGDDLAPILEDEEVSGGDFVRNVKQLIDLLRQVGDHAPNPTTASTARSAADQALRGVVAASSVVGQGPSPTTVPVDP